jgi:hypothetical protein
MEAEQQQGQKTVVAFISGLLIGGLLMWVFGAEPKKDGAVDVKKDDTKDTVVEKDAVDGAAKAEVVDASKTEITKPEVSMTNAAIGVQNQAASKKVTLGDVKFPTDGGWIAVHTMDGETLGPVLGAARYNVETGLLPKEVELLASLTAGDSYAVVFHDDNKDGKYTSAGDKVMMAADGKFIGSTFKAE